MQPQNFDSGFQGGYPQPMPFATMQPQNFDSGFQGGYPQPMPFAAMPPQNFALQFGGTQGIVDPAFNPQPAQMTDANGFMKPVQTDTSGFPFASESQAPSFDGASPAVGIIDPLFDEVGIIDPLFDEVAQDPTSELGQAPQQ
jgi:hypothetical protein